MKLLHLSKALIRIQLQDHLAYFGMLFIWMFEIFFLPIVLLYVWHTIAQSSPPIHNQIQTIINYYTILPLIILVTSAWHGDYVAKDIRTGDLNQYLTKPYIYLYKSFTANIASKIVKSIFLIPLFIVGTMLFPTKLNLTLSASAFFVTSLCFTYLLAFFRDTFLGLAAFWLDDIGSFRELFAIAEFTLGGRLVPVFFFPPLIRSLANLLPFRYFTAFPLEILSQQLTLGQICTGFFIQAVWLTIFSISSYKMWCHGLKRYSATGG